MPFTVPDAVRATTTKCRHNFSCLETECCPSGGQCTLEDVVNEKIFFVRKNDGVVHCPYQIPFGHGTICSCPTYAALLQQKNTPRGEAPPPGKVRDADT